MRTWSLRVLVAVVLIALAWLGLERLVHLRIRKAIDEQAEHFGARVSGYEMTSSVWDGSAVITGLELLPIDQVDPSPFSIEGRLDSISVLDIRWFRTLTTGRCAIGHVIVRSTGLRLMKNDTASAESQDQKKKRSLIHLKTLDIERLNVHLVSSSYIEANDTGAKRMAERVALFMEDLHIPLADESNARIGWNELSLEIRNTEQVSADGYRIEMDHLELSGRDSTLLLNGIRFGPPEDLEAYGTAVKQERDVFEGSLDTLRFSRFHLNKVDLDQLAVGGSLRLSSGKITVLRDKRRPDPPYIEKPLIAGLINKLSDGQGLDSIRILNLDITYLEHSENGSGFARFPVTSLQALVTGARALPDAVVEVRAGAMLFGTTPISLSITAPATDQNERFTMRADMGALAFRSVDPLLRPATGLSAQEGRLDTLVLKMSANRINAQGTITMRYSDLRVRSLDKDVKGSAITAALGLLRRSNREVDGRVETIGFDVVRRRDRAIFNYLWSGLREGMKSTVLPGMLNGATKK